MEPLGNFFSRLIDVRIILTTNEDLKTAVVDKRFRSDLFFRVNVYPIVMPRLRKRAQSPLRIRHLTQAFSNQIGKRAQNISSEVSAVLTQYDWPDNTQELQNVMKRPIITQAGQTAQLNTIIGRLSTDPHPPKARTTQSAFPLNLNDCPVKEEHRPIITL